MRPSRGSHPQLLEASMPFGFCPFFPATALVMQMVAGVVTTSDYAFAEYTEYAVKGEFIERFTRFIDWPENAFASADAPFVICILGENPFGDYLDRLARNRKIKDRTVQVSHPSSLRELDRCHVLFIARSEKGRVGAVVARAENKPILTVGDTTGFAEEGVLVNFYQEEGSVHFEINASAAKRSSLRFSSQVMKLARIVNPGQDTRDER